MTFHYFAFLFSIEVLVAEFIFLKKYEKRNYFYFRLIGAALITMLYALFMPFDSVEGHKILSSFINFLRYFSTFILSIFAYWFCFKEKFTSIFTGCALGYLIQNITNRIYIILDYYILLFNNISSFALRQLLKMIVYYVIPYILVYIIFRDYAERNEGDRRLNLLSISIVIVSMCFTRVFDYMDMNSIVVKFAQLFLSLAFGVPILIIQSVIYDDIRKEELLETTNVLLHETNKEFNRWKESIDIINIKVHDLKKMINKYEKDISKEYIKEIEDAIFVYESVSISGNDIIDNIILEKNNVCKKNGINFVYLIDGKALDFIKNEDLYALFTNIIDNAIEANMKIEDKEKRVIHLSVSKENGTVIITSENYFEGELSVNDNRIQTSKDSKEYHGFGLLSIEKICEKYNGIVHVNTYNHVFSIQIAI